MSDVAQLGWPLARLAEGFELLARAARLPVEASGAGVAAHGPTSEPVADEWMQRAGYALGLEVDAVTTTGGDVSRLLRNAAPAVVAVDHDGETRYVMLVARGRRRVQLLDVDQKRVSVDIDLLRRWFIAPYVGPLVAETIGLVEDIGVPPRRRQSLADALIDQRLRSRRVGGCWLLRVPAEGSLRAQLFAIGAPRAVGVLAAAYLAGYLVWILSWWVLGRSALRGQFDGGWLTAWGLLLATFIPLHLVARYLQGRLAIDLGALLKQRLLQGALRLKPEEVRNQGVGQLLGRVIESQAVESLALSGGFLALFAVLELMVSTAVLGAASVILMLLLLAWTAVAVTLAWVYLRRRRAWTGARISMTHALIERMLGQRTRLVQQPRERWHEGEDEALSGYVEISNEMDRSAVRLMTLVPRGWLLVGIAGFAPTFVAGQPPAVLAVAIGGILLAFRAFKRLATAFSNLADAEIACRQIAPVFQAATRREHRGVPAHMHVAKPLLNHPVLRADNISFRHSGRVEPALEGCNLAIAPGDHVLLEGASGSGKSTLAAILAGLRQPDSGLVMLGGVDQPTLGLKEWRRRAALVPQFHENHVLLGTVAFNVLMGVAWPPAAADFAKAEEVCRELGLGDLLDRMPAGLL